MSSGEMGAACGKVGYGTSYGTEAADRGGVTAGDDTVWASGSGDDAGSGDTAADG
jgi:hypothetical protein